MPNLRGTLVHPDAVTWSGYRATAAWISRATDESPSESRFRSVAVGADGTFVLDLPPAERVIDPIDLAVNAPTGELVYRMHGESFATDTDAKLEATTYVAPVATDAEVPEGAGKRVRVFGRALARTGEPARAGETVVLWGASAEGREASPFVSATISVGGYFSADRPPRRFARAFATVGTGAAIPIPLAGGLIPEKLVLMGDLPAGSVATDDCDCHRLSPPRIPGHEELTANSEIFSTDLGGRCVDLTIPNRALEEVTWHAVVRTSEPTVRSFTLDDDVKLPSVLLDGLVKITTPSRTAISAATVREPAAPARRSRRSRADVPQPAPLPASPPINAAKLQLSAREALRILRPGETLKPSSVMEADRLSRFAEIRRLLKRRPPSPVRPPLNAAQQVDWDESPTLYQATSIAHGHVLTLRQTWHADGYSLGDLLYSLPLAPGQKKNIALIDWDRRDTVMRLSDRESRETLSAEVQRDRDVEEIIRGALEERVRAGSSATRSAVGGGIGAVIGPVVLGGAGGSAWASSSAWQSSARDVAGRSMQEVRDRTVQSANATRSQRSTVVQSVQQGESVRAETTTVANYNHCHAMTVQHFEVLRHFQLTHEIVGVGECLFVPFLLSEFDAGKALRWREPLELSLRRRDQRAAFDAAQRVSTNWADVHVPVGAYADDPIVWIDAELTVRIDLPRPKDKSDDTFEGANWAPYEHLLTRDAEEEWRLWLGVVTARERNRVWVTRIAPRIARRLFDDLKLEVVLEDGTREDLKVDTTVVSSWRAGAAQLLTMRPSETLPSLTRRDINAVVISSGAAVPSVATAVIERGSMRYRTAYLHHHLFSERLIQNDLGTSDEVMIPVRLDRVEKRRPRDEDRRRTAALVDHLNSHLEYYHRAIWLRMHPNRRYLLLDGFEAPNAGGRSVASVVENRVIGVAGNSLIFPVAPGIHLDPNTQIPAKAGGDLLAYYNDTPPAPVRISVPTRGIFAEAILGQCNSCEVKDDTRFWRWEDAPIPDKPPELGTVSTASRRRAPSALRPDEFSGPLVQIQSIGDLPAPQALKAALDLIGTPDLFRDLTGVDLNIQHASKALSSALSTAQFFGGEAAKIAQQQFLARHRDRVLASIQDARDKGLITPEMSRDLSARALGASVGEKTSGEASKTTTPSVEKLLDRAARSATSAIKVERPSGKVEIKTATSEAAAAFEFTVDPPVEVVAQTSANVCWAAAGATMMNWRDQTSRSLQQAADDLGGSWRAKVDADESLGPADLRAYAAAAGLQEEGPASYTPRTILRMLQDFGPLWIVHDDFAENNKLVHARIVIGISGEGQGDQAVVRMLDPATPASAPEEDFATFARRLAAEDPVRFGVGLLHFAAQ